MAGEGWISMRLGDVCTKIGSGATPRGGSGVYLDAGTYALIRSQNIHNDGFHHEGLVYITKEHADQLSGVAVEPGDVLLNITGDSVARCCQVDPSVLPARVNQHVAIIRPDPNHLDARFLRYYMISPQMQEKMLSWAGSGGTRNALTKGMIETFQVFAPADVREQRAIACILGMLDDKIELNRRMNKTLDETAQAIFKSWYVDFDPVHAKATGQQLTGLAPEIAELFPVSFEESEIGEVPTGWKCIRLPELIDINPVRRLSKGKDAPYLDMASVPTSGHVPQGWHDRPFGSGMRFINGDTLVARITPCLENGKTAFVSFLSDRQVGWGSTEFIVLRPKPPLPPIFAYLLARSGDFRQFAIQQMTGSSGRQRVPAESLSKYFIARPPSELALVFGRIVEPLIAKIDANASESRLLAAVRDTLLPKLISGELTIPDAERMIERHEQYGI